MLNYNFFDALATLDMMVRSEDKQPHDYYRHDGSMVDKSTVFIIVFMNNNVTYGYELGDDTNGISYEVLNNWNYRHNDWDNIFHRYIDYTKTKLSQNIDLNKDYIDITESYLRDIENANNHNATLLFLFNYRHKIKRTENTYAWFQDKIRISSLRSR